MIFLSRHRARLLPPLLLVCLSLPSHAEVPAAPAGSEPVVEKPKSPSAKAAKPSATTQARQLPSVSVAVSQQPPGVSADAATSAASSASKAAAPPAKPAVPATTTAASAAPAALAPAPAPAPAKTITAAPTPQPVPAPINAAVTTASPKPAVPAASSAPVPTKPAVATKPAAAAGNAPAYGTISESERRALATMPLPKLPTLVPRQMPATSAATAAAAALPAPPAPSIRPSVTAESPTVTEIRSLLAKASERTGLGDAQLASIAQFDATAARGEQENALVGLLRLNDELDAAYNSYNVGTGESLWQIAAKPETYGNANLWPLIWRANPRALPQPSQVKSGQKLRVPRYPSLKAVTEALDYAASHPVEKQ